MLFGLVSYAINRRRRDYTSVMQVIAASYSVIVDHELVNRARNLLASGPHSASVSSDAAPHPSDPPPHPSDLPPHPSDPPPASNAPDADSH
jgi:hypothetical protein